jgi:hypothetical protein
MTVQMLVAMEHAWFATSLLLCAVPWIARHSDVRARECQRRMTSLVAVKCRLHVSVVSALWRCVVMCNMAVSLASLAIRAITVVGSGKHCFGIS